MSFSSLAFQRGIVSLTAIFLVSACSENGREAPLSKVDTIDIPVADIDNQTNQNINNPTLQIPTTFQVSDGDLLTLVWSDEFNGAQLDPEVWFYESGDGTQYGIPFPSWGNNELQYYLPDNVQLANGALQVTARREAAEDFNFTSGRVMTRDRFAFKYGRIEASIKLPSGQGLWPAFWMLPQDDEPDAAPGKGTYGVYAQSGEIDIVEAINLDAKPTPDGRGGDNEIFSTIHFGGDSSIDQNLSSETRYTPSFDVTGDFHTYAFEWDEFEMRWYADGTLYKVENSWSSAGGANPAPFDQPFDVLFNLAVGGDFPGSPDGTTPSPATMEVDWVRVYSGEDTYVPANPGTIPDDVLYASDPNEPIDLVFGVDYKGFDPFGSGSSFNNNNTSDRDFSPAFGVTTGNGYTAQVGQLGIFGFAAGFATNYERLEFKAKNLNNDLIRVKFNPDGGYLDITLTNSQYATALGNGWYQVSVPIADFSGADTATTLLFETDNTALNAFTYLLTDLGFSGTGGGGPSITPEAVVYATDPGITEDLVAGDADYNPAFQVISGEGYGAGVHVGFVAFNGYAAGFAAGYGTFEFKAKINDIAASQPFEVKFINGGDTSVLYDLTTYSGSTDLGNGWYQVQIPMTDFAATVAGNSGLLMGPAGGQANAFTMLLTDIGFSGTAGGGGGGSGTCWMIRLGRHLRTTVSWRFPRCSPAVAPSRCICWPRYPVLVARPRFQRSRLSVWRKAT
jgi:beta-glucanase (GH16 family)